MEVNYFLEYSSRKNGADTTVFSCRCQHIFRSFFSDGSCKVFVTKYLLRHRKYPLSGKEVELQHGEPLEII